LGAQVGYFIIIGSLLTPLVHEIGLTALDFEVITAIIGLVVILPLCCLRHMDSLQYTSFVALFFIGCLGIGVLVKGIKRLSQHGVDPSFAWFGDFAGFFVSLPILNFAFTFHPSIPPVWQELNDSSKYNINLISMISVVICAIFYATLGIFGYLYHYNETPDNILLAYEDDVLFVGLKLGYSLVIIFSYPVINFATRMGIDSLLFKKSEHMAPTWRLILEAFIIVCITYGIAMGIPSIDIVFGLLGSTIGQLVIFINPAIFYLVLYEPPEIEIEGTGNEVRSYNERGSINYRRIFTLQKLPALSLIIFGLVCGTISVIEISQNIHRLLNASPSP